MKTVFNINGAEYWIKEVEKVDYGNPDNYGCTIITFTIWKNGHPLHAPMGHEFETMSEAEGAILNEQLVTIED